jgi:superfamily II DNA or RNA helicase
MRLAELIGVSFASVNRWENGQSRPSALAWQQITRAEILGIEALGGGGDAQSLERDVAVDSESQRDNPPGMDFAADPEAVRVIVEGERLRYGHQFNPAFATEISLIDPLPHQRIAVYEHMLKQARLRFLLADDAGAGKTIMAGLYIREMVVRRLLHRVLIVPPAGLVGNWRREMCALFSLPFRIVGGSEARTVNPFIGLESNLLIISVDTLAGERMFSRLQASTVEPYDLVIFDEAHKLSADREPDLSVRKTDRYLLAEVLAGMARDDPRWQLDWSCRHLLLLTATPHMGKDFPYYCLWRLLEPEVLSTMDAFHDYPVEARQRHFMRRTKEEMVRFDGSPIYPTRLSDTLSYDLSQGEISEQRLYDETTNYIRLFYNRARILNRSAARMAMSIFQRRLASSTYAVLRSLARRLDKLQGLIDAMRSGQLTPEQMVALQRHTVRDVLEEKTADEEGLEDGREENEVEEERTLRVGVVAASLAELEAERTQVQALVELAHRVYDLGEESKFEKLRAILQEPQYKDEKIIIFTEHRDTLTFLARRLEGLGFTGQVAQLHGGMDYQEREEQVDFFRQPAAAGGASYLLATDAAGEGINLQFCWLMVNYDIPWNPARLEQRMGRIHRYNQQHDPVIILNLVAGKTREGRVLKTLLEKLERIRRELGSDKVFDVVGRIFEGVSITDYMERAVTADGEEAFEREIASRLTRDQITAIQEREKRLYGNSGEVRSHLPRLQMAVEQETYRKLLPGYVRRFVEKAAPLVDLGIAGDLDGIFSLQALKPAALDPLWPSLEAYPPEQRNRLTVYRPETPQDAIFLHPGELLFERLHAYVSVKLQRHALQGGVFVDPTADQPYLFHLALITVARKADVALRPLAHDEVLAYCLVGLRHMESRPMEECPVEHLLLLKAGQRIPPSVARFALTAPASRELARVHALERIASSLTEEWRQSLLKTLPEREDFLRRGYDYQDIELAATRTRLTEKARAGDPRAQRELPRIRERQRQLFARRDEALAVLHHEPELIAPHEVAFLAHALVVPSSDPEDRKRHDEQIEAIAVKVAWAHEEAHGAVVKDVSTPALARAAGLPERPGFDLLSLQPAGEERGIEVKGRAGIGDIELTENEWVRACNLRERYWLYVVYECATAHPRLLRIQDPFGKLIVRAKGSVVIEEREIFAAAEGER